MTHKKNEKNNPEKRNSIINSHEKGIKKKGIKYFFKKLWFFLWYDESLLSFISNLLLAFIIIKFIFYPGISYLLNTAYPVVAVVSGSMEHDGSFDDWWAYQEDFYLRHNITKKEFLSFPFHNGFNKGDIMIVKGTDANNIKKGEIIVFDAGLNYPVIHRVIYKKNYGNKTFFGTKGDHNRNQANNSFFDETMIPKKKVFGKTIFRIPYVGYIKIWFYELISKLINNNLLKPSRLTIN